MSMNNKKIFLFSLIFAILIGAGCSFTDPQKQQEITAVLQEKGLTKLLSPEEYRAIIDLELAKLAREKLLSPKSENEIMIEEVEVQIQEIKNNCNLSLPESVVLSSDLEQKLKNGHVCRYVKGSTASMGRTDNFTIKFFGKNPFEFGIDDQINFPTNFGYLKFKNITGSTLVESQAQIITLAGEIYLESAGPTIISSSQNNSSDFDEDFDVIVGLKPLTEPQANSKIFLVLPDDEGKRGERIACGDSLIDIGVRVDFTSNDKVEKIKTTLNKLFSIENKEYSTEPLIINPLYKSNLAIESVKVNEKRATVVLVGNLSLEGICDTPRFEEQIKATVKQFGGIEIVDIIINPLSEKDFF